jgi:hypothetical protein
MQMNRIVIVVLISWGFAVIRTDAAAGNGTADSIRYAYSNYIEEITNDLGADDAGHLIEYIESLRDTPLNIAAASADDLAALPFLTSIQAEHIVAVRRERGTFESPDDLLETADLPPDLIYLLLNFIVFDAERRDPRRRITSIRSRSFASYELHERRGYADGVYLGSPLSTYHRVAVRGETGVQGEFLLSKRAGEPSLAEEMSGYISLGLMDRRVNMVAGHYRLHVGQGLLLWSGFGMSKGGNTTRGVFRGASGVRPAASRSDHHRFRGIAATLDIHAADILLFYASTPRTANVRGDGTVTALTAFPIFNTSAMQARKNAVRETLHGFSLRRRFGTMMEFGAAWYSLRFDHEFDPSRPSGFSGTKRRHGGFDWRFGYRNFSTAGEAAAAIPEMRTAVTASMNYAVTRQIETALLVRTYPAAYVSMYAYPFMERGATPDDEQGVYMGLRLRPLRRYLIEGYFDGFRFSNALRSPALPSTGTDGFLRVQFPLGPGTSMEARVRRRHRDQDVVQHADGVARRITAKRVQTNIRAILTTQLLPSFRLRLRSEHTIVSFDAFDGIDRGWYVSADMRWSLPGGLTFDSRMLFFDTDSFDAAVYAVLYDMPGSMRLLTLSGQGTVAAVGAGYVLRDTITLHVRYTETYRSDGTTISSGLQATGGPVLGMVQIQIDIHI